MAAKRNLVSRLFCMVVNERICPKSARGAFHKTPDEKPFLSHSLRVAKADQYHHARNIDDCRVAYREFPATTPMALVWLLGDYGMRGPVRPFLGIATIPCKSRINALESSARAGPMHSTQGSISVEDASLSPLYFHPIRQQHTACTLRESYFNLS